LGWVEDNCVSACRAALDYYQSSAVREYRVHEGDQLHMACNAPRSLPNATFSWSIARDVDTSPLLLTTSHRMQISDNGTHTLHRIHLGRDLGHDLRNILRQSHGYLRIMPESRWSYDGRLRFTRHFMKNARLFLGTDHLQIC